LRASQNCTVAPPFKLGGILLAAAAAASPAAQVDDDARVQRAVERARSQFLASQPFDRVDVTVLVQGKDGRWLRGAVNGGNLSYPASCMKLAVLVGATHWCAAQGGAPDCLDKDVRPMIETSDDFATGRVIDAITGTVNVEPVDAPGYEPWYERRLYVERLLDGQGLLDGQRLLTKTYPSNSSEEPSGFEYRAWKAHGRNAMAPDFAARLMLAIVEGEVEPQARDYMRGLLRRDRFSPYSVFGPGLPPGTVYESKIGNAFDVLAEIAYAELPNGRRLILAAFTNGWDQNEPEPYDTARLGPLAQRLVRELDLDRGLPPRRTLQAEHVSPTTWRWRASVPRDRRYELLVSFPKRESATPRAIYEVDHAGGNTRVEIDQRHWSERWIKLGDFEPRRGRLTVTLTGGSPGEVAAGPLSVARWPD
jgi:hypothetical protein